tara:strand:+ start:5291 stop:6547 length:1257 start_codon:yes stop_codon:yes gene_type:complete
MFRSWCQSNGLFNKNNLSHVLMDGGVLSVPFDKLNSFYKTYIDAVRRGEHVFVVEQKTETYNFFVDIDYKDDDELDIDQVQLITKVICDKVSTFGGSKCVISIQKPRLRDGQYKSGVHMNWPGFVVNQESAVNLRGHIVDILSKVYGSKAWSKIIDNSVYGDPGSKSKGSGFRLPWSHKKSKHEACGGKGCELCDHTGKITEGMYLPVLLYNRQGGVGPLKLPAKIEKLDGSISLELLNLVTVRTDIQETIGGIKPIVGKEPFTKAVMDKEVVNNELTAFLETFIRQNLEGQRDARITKVFKKNDTDYYISTYSKYCENLGREHGSNHVWFNVKNSKKNSIISQKCFCRCETVEERKKGYCRDFEGQKHMLTPKLISLMFPKKNKVSTSIKKAILPNAVVNPNISNISNTIAIYTKSF